MSSCPGSVTLAGHAEPASRGGSPGAFPLEHLEHLEHLVGVPCQLQVRDAHDASLEEDRGVSRRRLVPQRSGPRTVVRCAEGRQQKLEGPWLLEDRRNVIKDDHRVGVLCDQIEEADRREVAVGIGVADTPRGRPLCSGLTRTARARRLCRPSRRRRSSGRERYFVEARAVARSCGGGRWDGFPGHRFGSAVSFKGGAAAAGRR